MLSQLLTQLEEKIEVMPEQCFFNEGLSYDELTDFLDQQPFLFPISYFPFLLNHNGGFMCYENMKGIDFESMAWNSNRFLSISEIEHAYQRIHHKFSGGKIQFVPFMQVENAEYLAFKYPLEEHESPVYDIWHEAFPAEWLQQEVYSGFYTLLDDYIRNDGFIRTIG